MLLHFHYIWLYHILVSKYFNVISVILLIEMSTNQSIKKKSPITIKLDPEIKERFLTLAKEEKLSITDAVEHLVIESLSRGYIVKERHEALKEVNG